MGKCTVGLVAFAIAASIAAPVAHAAFPGANGRIAFDRDFDECFNERIYLASVNPDGTGFDSFPIDFEIEKQQQASWSSDSQRIAFYEDGGITTSKPDGSDRQELSFPGFAEQPAWSPYGTRIVFSGAATTGPMHIWSADPDGGNATQLTFGTTGETEPAWSPDGSRIAYTAGTGTGADIYTMNVLGGGQTPVTANAVPDGFPNWSPDGARLVFERAGQIWTAYAGGGNEIQLTSAAAATTPAWSPDGSRIAFARGSAIWTMSAAGGDEDQITPGAASNQCDANPDWQPIPINVYPRPRGASPMYISLVPAYKKCTAANRTHGAPLAFGSCAPPAQTTPQVTLGTPDANGQAAKGVAAAIVTARPGNSATPADEADVRIGVSVTDVRWQTGLDDYGDTLVARPVLRITDRDNTPSPGGPGAATVIDVAISFQVPCATNVDPSTGSTCAVTTTADSVVPGAAKEGRRSIWELDGFEITDGEAPFLRQGLFVP
jgi:hypothetical protein